jgi:hypothetical protein
VTVPIAEPVAADLLRASGLATDQTVEALQRVATSQRHAAEIVFRMTAADANQIYQVADVAGLRVAMRGGKKDEQRTA